MQPVQKEEENNNEEVVKPNKTINQNNPKFIETLNNEQNLNKQYLDTIQFNQGKDYLQVPKGNDKNYQTNMNNTM